MPLRGTPSVATAPPAVDVTTRTPPPDPASLQPSAVCSGAPMNVDAERGPENSAAANVVATAGLANAIGDKDRNQSHAGAGGPAQPLAHAEDATTAAVAVAVGYGDIGADQDVAADAEEEFEEYYEDEEYEEYYEETYEEDADGAGADASNVGQQSGPGQRGPKQQLKQLSFEEAAQRHEAAAHTGGGSGVARLPSDRSKRSALRATSSECPARVQRKVAAPTSVVVKGYRYDPYTSPSGKELWDDDEEEIAQQPSPGNGQLRGTPIARIRPPERWGIPGKHPHGAPTNMPPLGADAQPAQSDEHLQYAQNNNQQPQPHGFQQGGQPHGAQQTAQQYGDESPYDSNVNAPIGHGGQQGGMYQGDQQHPQHGQGYPPQGGQGQYVPGGTPPPSPPMHGQYHQGAPAPVAPPSPSAQHLQHFPAQHHQPQPQPQHPQPHHGGGQQGQQSQQGQQQGGGGQPIALTGALQQQYQHHQQQQQSQQSQQPDLAALWCFLPPPPVRATTLQEMLDNGIEDEEAEQAVTSMSTRWFVHLKRKTKDLAADLDALDVTTVSQAQVPRLTSLRGLVAALNSVGDCPAPDFKKVSCARWSARCHQWWSRLSTGFAEARHGQTAAGRAPAVARPEAEDEREVLRQEREAAEVKAKTDRRNQRELERLERKETERRAKYEALEGERWVKKRDAIAAVLSELRANDTSSSLSSAHHHGPSSAAAGHSSAVVASMPAQHQEEHHHESAQPQEGHVDQRGSSSSTPTNKVRVTPPPPHQQKFVETFTDRKVLQRVALPGFGDDTATETVLTLPTTASSATASSDNTFPTTTDPAISGKLVIPPFNGNMVFAAPPPPNTRVMRKNALLDDPSGPGLKPPSNPRGNARGGGNRDRCGGAGGGAFTAPQPETPARESITAAENGAIAMLAYRWFTRVSEVQVQWLPEFDHTGVRCHCPTLPQVREEFLKKALKSKSTSKSAKSATVAAAALACVSDTASLASLAEGPGSALGIDLENVPQNVLDDIVDTWMDVCHAWWKEHFSLGGRRGAAAAVATTVKISVGAGNKGETVDPALFKPKPRGKNGNNNGGGGGGNNGRNAGPPRHGGGGGGGNHNPAGGYHQPPPPPPAHHANVPEQQAGYDHQHQVGGHAPPPHAQAQPQYYYAPHPHYAQGQAPPVSYPPGPYYAQPPQPMYYQQGGYPAPPAAPAPAAAPGAAAPHAQYQQHEQQDHHGGGGGRGEDRRRSSRQDSRRGHGGYDDQNAAAAAAAAAAPSPSAAQYAYPEQQYPQATYYGGAPGGYAAAAAPPPHHQQQPAHGYYQ